MIIAGKVTAPRAKLPGGTIQVLLAIAFLVQGQSLNARVELQPCKNGIPPEKQIELGQKAAQQVYQQMPVLPDSSSETAYIQGLGKKLTAEAPGYKWPYNFHVVNVAEVNAFALPGGSVFVNLGTIQAASDEAQLAAVMAHEISHVVLQHSVCNAEKQQKLGLIAGIGQLAAGVLLGSKAGQLAQESIGFTAGLGFLRMSREAEQQADLMGVGILYDAGYDPHAMAQFFETLQQKYGKGSAQFLSDHPNPGNRSEYVDKEVAGFVPRAHYITNTPAFSRMHSEVAAMHAYTAKEVASGVWRHQVPNQTVSTGVNELGANSPSSGTPDLDTSGAWKTFHGAGFSIRIPADWQGVGSPDAAIFAPSEGIARSAAGRTGLVYGLLTDRYRLNGQVSLDGAFNALLSEITKGNPGLEPGRTTSLTVGGANGRSVGCENRSSNSGRGEYDWIVAFPNSDSLRYFVFVAPIANFASMKPTFETILRSIMIE